MGWMRTGAFICLTLVATTLPVSALAAPWGRSRPAAKASAPDQTADGAAPADSGLPKAGDSSPESREAPDNPAPVLQAPCQMDVSRTAPARPLGNSGPELSAPAVQAAPEFSKLSPLAGGDLQSSAGRVHEHAREWLTCRYPNAPPAGY